ncbi:MAG: outer membrane protein, partial [Pararhizobium sp.]
MLRILTLSCAAAWALSAIAAPAAAADLDQVLVAPELPPIKPVEVGSGWYLRGDVGYSVDIRGGADSFRGVGGGTGRFEDGEIQPDWSESVGLGYHFHDWLRSAVT